MSNAGGLTVTSEGERDLVITCAFDAPRARVFDAWTTPEAIKRWLLGPPEWSMVVCDVDLKPGGRYRYVWKNVSSGTEMGMGGVYREVVAPERLVATEKFDEAWYPGEGVGTFVFAEQGGRTTVAQTMRYESREARDAVIKSNMEQGLAASFDRLAEYLRKSA